MLEKTSLAAAIAAKEQRNQVQIVENQEQTNPAMQELLNEIQDQKAQNQLLLQQLEQNKNVESKKAQEEATKIAAEEAAKLAEDADLKKTLSLIEGDKYEQLTNKEVIDIVASGVETAMDARNKQLNQILEARIGDVSDQIVNTQKAVMQIATGIDVKDVKSKHDDFDKFQKEAAVIMQDTPGISVERAYRLAKAEAEAKVPPKSELDRERPDTTISRSRVNQAEEVNERNRPQERASERKTGIASVRDIINAGIDKVLSQRGD